MSIGLYQATAPTFKQVLNSLANVLAKAEAHCAEAGVSPDTLIQARLIDDMHPLPFQFKMTILHSVGALKGVMAGAVKFDMTPPPATFAELKAQNAEARAEIEAITPGDLNACVGRDVTFGIGERTMTFLAEDYVFSFAQPNFFFHASTAYGILRNRGVKLGKGDFLGQIRIKPQ